MTQHIMICGLRRVDHLPAWEDGARPLANFDVEVAGFRVRGCLLLLTARGEVTAQTPKVAVGPAVERVRHVEIIDRKLRHELTVEALHLYELFGGEEGLLEKGASAGGGPLVGSY